MQVELAEERVFRFAPRVSQEEAEGRAWAKRLDAFGALSKVAGLLSKPRDEEFSVVYREQRLQPFWRCALSTLWAYEREREYRIKVAPEVRTVELGGEQRGVQGGEIMVRGLESCREEGAKELLVDGLALSGRVDLSAYLKFDAAETTAEELSQASSEGLVVVPPEHKASAVVRDAIAGAITKFDADRVTEELVRIEAIDLYYRPVFAFRYRRQDKEAVVEVDGLTGAATVGGATFEAYLGRAFEPRFLIDFGAEAINMVVPGANLAKMVIVKSLEMRGRR